MWNRIRSYLKRNGLSALLWRCLREIRNFFSFHSYHKWACRNALSDDTLMLQRKFPFSSRPLVSIVVPAYNTPPKYLNELAESILAQTYENWELIIADGNSPKEDSRQCLNRLASRDKRICPLFLSQNGGISENTNAAIAKATGDYVVFADHDDLLAPDALFELVKTFLETDADFIYSDEDKIDEHSRRLFAPHFKPDFSLDYLRCTNYMCHLSAIRRTCLLTLGGLNPLYDGSQDHDFNIRVAENGLKIIHIPKVLYHWRYFRRSLSNSNNTKCRNAACNLVQAHLGRLNILANVSTQAMGNRVHYLLSTSPQVSILIQGTHSDSEMLKEFLIHHTSYSNIEFCSNVTIARGEYVVFIAADVYPEHADWLGELLGYAQQDNVFAVCGRLFDRKNRISFAGMFFIDGFPRYSFFNYPRAELGIMSKAICAHNISAVCPDFCMIRKSDFRFETASKQNIIASCLESNGRKIYVPDSVAKRKTRNPVVPEEYSFYFSAPFKNDPFYNINLSKVKTDWSVAEKNSTLS